MYILLWHQGLQVAVKKQITITERCGWNIDLHSVVCNSVEWNPLLFGVFLSYFIRAWIWVVWLPFCKKFYHLSCIFLWDLRIFFFFIADWEFGKKADMKRNQYMNIPGNSLCKQSLDTGLCLSVMSVFLLIYFNDLCVYMYVWVCVCVCVFVCLFVYLCLFMTLSWHEIWICILVWWFKKLKSDN